MWESLGTAQIALLALVAIPVAIVMLRTLLRLIAPNNERLSPNASLTRPRVTNNVAFPYGVAETQGNRQYMEDRHVAVGELRGDPRASFYGVFDGHGGAAAAEYCAAKMCENVVSQSDFPDAPGDALVSGFLQTDREFLEAAHQAGRDDGTTAVVALTLGDTIHVGNAGDSRAIVVQRKGRTVPLSDDHKPNRPDEKQRVQDLGGNVVFWGVWRVEGVLAVSRAIGDRLLKTFVTSEPEVMTHTRGEDDCFLVLGSDGLWDVLSNAQVAQIALECDNPQTAAHVLVQEAYRSGSSDNICVVCVDLR